jgi:hypothetical protein
VTHRKAEMKEIADLAAEKNKILEQIVKAKNILSEKEEEKRQVTSKLKQLKVYETFLFKVMKATEEYEKGEKPKDAIKKMIERYLRLKSKQSDLNKVTKEMEELKVGSG